MIAGRLTCGRYDFGSSVEKSAYYGFANSGSSPRDKNAFSAKLICDKWKFGCYNDSLLTNVLYFAFLWNYRLGTISLMHSAGQ
jgi:hypothetical protein